MPEIDPKVAEAQKYLSENFPGQAFLLLIAPTGTDNPQVTYTSNVAHESVIRMAGGFLHKVGH